MAIYCGGLTADRFAALPVVARVHLAAADLVGYRYGRRVTFPAARAGLPPSLCEAMPRPGRLIDCSSALAYTVITATPGGRWDRERYEELQIMDPARPYSPLDALERAGVGSRVPRPVCGLAGVCQTWMDDQPPEVDGDGVEDGHSRVVVVDRADPDLLWVFESTTRENRIGPRWSLARFSELVERYRGGVRLALLGAG